MAILGEEPENELLGQLHGFQTSNKIRHGIFFTFHQRFRTGRRTASRTYSEIEENNEKATDHFVCHCVWVNPRCADRMLEPSRDYKEASPHNAERLCFFLEVIARDLIAIRIMCRQQEQQAQCVNGRIAIDVTGAKIRKRSIAHGSKISQYNH